MAAMIMTKSACQGAGHAPAMQPEAAMAITPPGPDQLRQLAARYGLTVSDEDVQSLGAMVTGALASYDEVERL